MGGRVFHCRVVHIDAPKKEISYWIAEDEIAPFLVKERGNDEDVAYEILLREYNKGK